MDKTYSWAEIRDQAAEAFGGYPDSELEEEIIEVFRERPAFVVDAIAGARKGYEAGRLHSPWLVIRKQLRSSPVDVVVNDNAERDGAVKRANAWLHSSGLHFDRRSEVEDELFGERGSLRRWSADEELRERLLAVWEEQRPRGEQAEREAEESAEHRREVREQVAEKVKAA